MAITITLSCFIGLLLGLVALLVFISYNATREASAMKNMLRGEKLVIDHTMPTISASLGVADRDLLNTVLNYMDDVVFGDRLLSEVFEEVWNSEKQLAEKVMLFMLLFQAHSLANTDDSGVVTQRREFIKAMGKYRYGKGYRPQGSADSRLEQLKEKLKGEGIDVGTRSISINVAGKTEDQIAAEIAKVISSTLSGISSGDTIEKKEEPQIDPSDDIAAKDSEDLDDDSLLKR